MSTALVQTSTNVGNYGQQYVDATDQQLVAMFLHGRTANTVRKYARDLSTFFDWLSGRSYRTLALDDLQRWTETLTGAPKSVRERIATVRSFYKWSTQLGILRLNVAAVLETENVKSALHERIMSDEERDAMLAATTSTRDSALLLFLFYSGARVSEVCSLRAKDVRFAADGSCVVAIYRPKTNDTTYQNYGAASSMPTRLRSLLDGCGPDDYLFRSTGVPATIASRAGQNANGRLDTSAVLRIVKAAAKRAGITKPVSTHWLRHSCATWLVQRESNLHNVSKWLGHSNIATTMRYAHIVGDLDLSHHFA